jgi:hypothetical protein
MEHVSREGGDIRDLKNVEKAMRNTGFASLLLLPLLLAPLAYASTPATTITVTFTFNITPTSVTTHGGNTITTFTDVIILAGGAVGTINCAGVLVTHSDGSYKYRCDGTLKGTVTGGSGPGTASIHFKGSGTGATSEAHEVWDHGTGGLRGLHAHGTVVATFTSATGGYGSKTLHVRFDQ